MKVLFITAAFFPGNSPRAFRATELARELAVQGHEVVVATPGQGAIHNEKSKEWCLRIEDKAPEISGSFRGFYFSNPLVARVGNRMAEWLLEYPDIQYFRWAKKIASLYTDFDLMITIAAPHAIHWGVASMINTAGNKPARVWIADCGDPFMGSKMNTLPKMPWFAYVEHLFCKTCDFITVPVESAKTAYYQKYRDKIRVIPQGFNFETSISLRKPYRKNSIPTFGFAGSLSPGKREPRPFLEYLLQYKRPFQCTLFTHAENLVRSYAEKSGGKIIVRSYIPRHELFAEMSTMDFLVNFENEVTEQVPSKLIDYYLMGRPVLSIRAGIDFESTVRPFLEGDYSGAVHFVNADIYDIKHVAAAFLSLYSDGSSLS